MPTRRATGFTLVELLVVIGIIGLLIAILLPSLARARAKAVQTQCLSNLHQIAMGAYNYATDHQGQLIWGPSAAALSIGGHAVTDTLNGVTGPVSYNWDYELVVSNGNNQYSFANAPIAPYVKTQGFLTCPAMKDLMLPSNTGTVISTYGSPTRLVNKISQINSASETIAFAEVAFISGTSGAIYSTETLQKPSFGALYGPTDTFHGVHLNGLGNVGYCDGHASAVAVRVRPQGTYSSAPPAAVLNGLKVNRVGILDPGPIDLSTLNNTAYKSLCSSALDYPFWADKRYPGS